MQSVLRLGGQRWLAVLFLAIGLISGLRLVYATPMGQIADEPSHAVRAAALLHGEIIGSKTMFGTMPEAGVHVDPGIAQAALAEFHNDGKPLLTRSDRAGARAIRWWNKRLFCPANGTVPYLPVLYIPGALGIGAGGLIGLPPLQSLYLGRSFMLIGFVLLGSAALWVARAGRGVFFALLSLPMTMALAASFNQDGMIIGCCAFAGALLTMDESEFPKARWLAMAIIAVVICSKPPYGLLLFCAALPVFAQGVVRRLTIAGLLGLPALAWTIIMIYTSFIPRETTPYHPGPLWPGDPNILFGGMDLGAQLRVLLHSPALIVTLPYHYMIFYRVGLAHESIGLLGWLDVFLRHDSYVAWEVALVAALVGALLGTAERARRWRFPDALFVAAVIVATVIAVCLSMYLSWTPVGATLIEGVQGRYLLPLVAFVPLLLPRLGAFMPVEWRFGRFAAIIEAVSVVPAIAVACYDIGAVPALVHAKFG